MTLHVLNYTLEDRHLTLSIPPLTSTHKYRDQEELLIHLFHLFHLCDS